MDNMTIANTILAQLGGLRFIAMTGAREFVAVDSGLRFRVPRARDGINLVRIVLEPSDTYAVEFRASRTTSEKLVHRAEDIYAEDLRRVFTDSTGLETNL